MKALPTPGLAQPTNKLPTLEKQYKESWFYAFLRNIKLEEAAPKKRTQDTGASYLPSLVEADGKTFKAYSGSLAALVCPKA
ncbi:hypothetical protein [Endozoicomonas sp. 2B-B]